ncbi:uncharacterized protein LOC127100335 [Lathyrus oleraceus]|uniref:uncharacterized protein LOC127100335 n=1 Tax=Pisum sativum TaxID=3888 RepID=UPI0021D20E55|nr:uncharacterized protein LOC127100335 [Pisum sativum]
MDIERRNTRKYNFRRPDLMELMKLASFVDDPKDLRDCFGRLLSLLSTDVEDGLLFTLVQLLLPIMEEYAYLLGISVSDRFPFNGVEGILESRVITEVVHLKKYNVDDNLAIKGGIKGLPSKFLIEKDFSFANSGSMVAFEAILFLLIYGLVMFPHIDNFVDVISIRIFLVGNPVPPLFGDTYFSIHHMTYKGGGTIVCCVPLLYKLFISHLPRSHIFKENKGCLRWSQKLMSLTNDNITWYSFVYDDVKIIDSCDEFSNVPLLGIQGGINYNPALARRQLGFSMKDKPNKTLLESLFFQEGKDTQGLKARMDHHPKLIFLHEFGTTSVMPSEGSKPLFMSISFFFSLGLPSPISV